MLSLTATRGRGTIFQCLAVRHRYHFLLLASSEDEADVHGHHSDAYYDCSSSLIFGHQRTKMENGQ